MTTANQVYETLVKICKDIETEANLERSRIDEPYDDGFWFAKEQTAKEIRILLNNAFPKL